MDKTLKIYIALLVLLIAAIVVIDSNRPKPIDWTPTFSLNDRIPYGMYVFDQEIGSLLKDKKIRKFNTTPYEYLDSKFDYDTLVNDYRIKGTFLSISKMANFDNESITEICSFVQFGNNAFISS